jgi:hypothetical protein
VTPESEPELSPAVELAMQGLVDEVTDAICDLIRAVCMGDATLYRDLLERVALRLGGV